MQSERGCRIARFALLACVIANRSRSGKDNKGKVARRRQEAGVMLDKFEGQTRDRIVFDFKRNMRAVATSAKSGEVVIPAVKLVTNGAARVGDGGAHHEAGVIESKCGSTGWEELPIKIRQGFC